MSSFKDKRKKNSYRSVDEETRSVPIHSTNRTGGSSIRSNSTWNLQESIGANRNTLRQRHAIHISLTSIAFNHAESVTSIGVGEDVKAVAEVAVGDAEVSVLLPESLGLPERFLEQREADLETAEQILMFEHQEGEIGGGGGCGCWIGAGWGGWVIGGWRREENRRVRVWIWEIGDRWRSAPDWTRRRCADELRRCPTTSVVIHFAGESLPLEFGPKSIKQLTI